MDKHLWWRWAWFMFGALVYIIKRAFYMIKGPNPVANNVTEYLKVAGIPVLYRLIVDSGIYWACFSPEVLQAIEKYFGWETAAWVTLMVTQFAVCALFFGLAIDPLVDWAIPTVLGRIPFFKDWWPQMPGPLHAPQPETPKTD